MIEIAPISSIVKTILLLLLLNFAKTGISFQVNDYNNANSLEKVGEIKEGFSSSEDNFFIKITGICTDFEGNLYTIDSSRNKIFKFDSKGIFVKSFGRSGQGPGEFLGNPQSCHLSLSFGNDGKIYVVDPCNRRLSIFLTNGKYLRHFPINNTLYDSPAINSMGDIYLLSQSGIKMIERYDWKFKFKNFLYNFETHLQFPHGKPFEFGSVPHSPYEHVFSNKYEVIKLMDKNDNLIVISNYSFVVVIFDKQNKKVTEFIIDNKECIKDFKKKLDRLYKMYEQIWRKSKRDKGLKAFILPFGAFIDRAGNICIVYENIEGISRIYRYTTSGNLLERVQSFPDKIMFRHVLSDSNNFIFSISPNYEKIMIFKTNN